MPKTTAPQKILKMGAEMQLYLFGSEAAHYIREVASFPNSAFHRRESLYWHLSDYPCLERSPQFYAKFSADDPVLLILQLAVLMYRYRQHHGKPIEPGK
jgi:hypothetical protein